MLYFITFVPPILIHLYFINSDRFREPARLIIVVLILGFFIGATAGRVNDWFITNFSSGDWLNDTIIGGVVAGAMVEELLKFFILYFIIFDRKEFKEPMDGIVYGVTVSIGFAILENYDYIFRLSESYEINPYEMAVLRILPLTMHSLNGCIMGFYFSKLAFTGDRKYLGQAIFIPMLLHGLYNFSWSISKFLPYMILLMIIIFAIGLHRQIKSEQMKKVKKHQKII